MSASKSLLGKKKKTVKPQSVETPPSTDTLRSKLVDLGVAEDAEIRDHSGESEKMSEVLLAFASPLLGQIRTKKDFDAALDLAILSWNMTLVSDDLRQESFDKIIASYLPIYQPKIRTMIEMMIERKNTHFADNKRFIVTYHVVGSGRSRRLSVVSKPSPSATEDQTTKNEE